MAVIMTTDEKTDTLRIPISAAYLEGREAFAQGKDYMLDNPYDARNYTARLDWWIGHSDAESSVAVEFRQLAEENGARL